MKAREEKRKKKVVIYQSPIKPNSIYQNLIKLYIVLMYKGTLMDKLINTILDITKQLINS